VPRQARLQTYSKARRCESACPPPLDRHEALERVQRQWKVDVVKIVGCMSNERSSACIRPCKPSQPPPLTAWADGL
jgi:hypothetical protein